MGDIVPFEACEELLHVLLLEKMELIEVDIHLNEQLLELESVLILEIHDSLDIIRCSLSNL